LQCVAVCCSVLQCVAVCCSVLQCVAVCCSVLQCVAVCCSVVGATKSKLNTMPHLPFQKSPTKRGVFCKRDMFIGISSGQWERQQVWSPTTHTP